MSKAAEYRDYAAQCMRVAGAAVDEAERARWLDMARHWAQWAELEDKEEQKAKPP